MARAWRVRITIASLAAAVSGASACGAFGEADEDAVDPSETRAPAVADGGLVGDGQTADGQAAQCPPDMVFVAGEGRPFCIDRLELNGEKYRAVGGAIGADASDGTPECGWKRDYTLGKFVSDVRAVRVDWCAARRYCATVGKRLCGRLGGGASTVETAKLASEDEWLFACTRGGTAPFPYGPEYVAGACNVADAAPSDEAPGSRATCEGGFDGLFDMSGNLWEWTNTCRAEAPDGGAATVCLARGASNAAGGGSRGACEQGVYWRRDGDPDVGIRCCATPR